MAATDWGRHLARALRGLGSVLAGAGATGAASAATLPEDNVQALFHSYDGGGLKANGPALLVRKSLADRVSLSAQVYVDAVSNASIDVVTSASPFKEKRTAYDLGADTVVRDTTLTLGASHSDEPDYVADAYSLDSAQEVFGGMTTVSMGFTRGRDKVGKHGTPGWVGQATHWQLRAGVTQVLSTHWLAAASFESVADSGELSSPYRVARVFGAAVPERNPGTRTSRAVTLRAVGNTDALWQGSAVRASYRHYADTWDIRSHTTELGGSKYLGRSGPGGFLLETTLRFYAQDKALFYSDNATTETLYISRNRQLSTFTSNAVAARASYRWPGLPAGYDLKLTAGVESVQYRFKDFTDLRTGALYAYRATVLQLYASGTF